MVSQTGQPLQRVHGLEVPTQEGIHLRPVQHGLLAVEITLSDGGGTPEEVIAAARTASLDFVAITDHNNLDAKPSEG
jgi:hypothetical protein